MKDDNTNKNPVGLLLALVALLFIIIALIIMIRSCGKEEESAPTPIPTKQQTQTVKPQPPSPSLTPAPTPTITPTPEPTPEETPEPSPSLLPSPTPSAEVTPAPEIFVSGSFQSDTKTAMNIVVDWSASNAEDGYITIDVILSLDSLSLNLSSIYNGATLTINGEEFTFTTPVLKIEGDEPKKSELCRTHVKLPYDEGGINVPIEAVWRFNGVYSGVELKKIEVSGEASVG